jgi:flagellar basal-body rod protein FlgB
VGETHVAQSANNRQKLPLPFGKDCRPFGRPIPRAAGDSSCSARRGVCPIPARSAVYGDGTGGCQALANLCGDGRHRRCSQSAEASCARRLNIMLTGLFTSTTIPALSEVMHFAQARQTVLAGNIANVNTPGYRLRDLSPTVFQEELKVALAQGRQRARGNSPGLLEKDPGGPLRQVRASLENLVYHDDTNIDLEKQVAEMTKNHLLHNFALTVMTDQFQLLQTAISERV